MNRKMGQNLAKQIKQFGNEVLDQTVGSPGEAGGQALEQLGVRPIRSQPAKSKGQPFLKGARNELQVKKIEDQAKSEREIAQISKELKALIKEMKRLREQRKEEQRRRQSQISPKAKPIEEGKEVIKIPEGRQPKGLLAGLRSRKRSSRPELVGGRRSG